MMEGEDDKKGSSQEESCTDKFMKGVNSCCAKTGLCCFKFKEQSQISGLQYKISKRQQKFGVDYLTLVEEKAPPEQLKKCLKEAMADINGLQKQINEHHDQIDKKTAEVNGETSGDGGSSPTKKKPAEESKTEEGAGGEPSEEPVKKAPAKKKKKKPVESKSDDENFTIE